MASYLKCKVKKQQTMQLGNFQMQPLHEIYTILNLWVLKDTVKIQQKRKKAQITKSTAKNSNRRQRLVESRWKYNSLV